MTAWKWTAPRFWATAELLTDAIRAAAAADLRRGSPRDLARGWHDLFVPDSIRRTEPGALGFRARRPSRSMDTVICSLRIVADIAPMTGRTSPGPANPTTR